MRQAKRPKRQPGNTFLWGGFFALLLLAMMIAGNWFGQAGSPQISLPSAPLGEPPSGASPTFTSGDATATLPAKTPMVQVDVTMDNVREIAAGLSQPTEYQCVWQVEWFWPTGSRTAKRKVFVRDGYIKTEIYDANDQLQQHLISGEGRVFIYSPGIIWQPERGDFTAETEASLPVFSLPVKLNDADILSAEYKILENTPCIYVTFSAAGSRYVDAYWLSWDDGLPIRMERSLDDQIAIRCVRASMELARPGDENFRLPSNQFPWEIE